MNKDTSKKITTLGVVIFSFVALGVGALVMLAVGVITTVLALKTSMPESILMIGSIIGSGLGTALAAFILTVWGRVKGIWSALIVGSAVAMIKLVGKTSLGMGGIIGWSTLLGVFTVIIFALVGGALGSYRKR